MSSQDRMTISDHTSTSADDQQQRRQQAASQRTRRELDDLVAAMQRLDAALASPAPSRERRWASRINQELSLVRESLEAHILSAEGPNGLFGELDLTRPTVANRLAQLRYEHSRLLEMAAELCSCLEPDGGLPDYSSLRSQAAEFLTALRRHHAAEVDLVFECFWTDLGVGD